MLGLDLGEEGGVEVLLLGPAALPDPLLEDVDVATDVNWKWRGRSKSC